MIWPGVRGGSFASVPETVCRSSDILLRGRRRGLRMSVRKQGTHDPMQLTLKCSATPVVPRDALAIAYQLVFARLLACRRIERLTRLAILILACLSAQLHQRRLSSLLLGTTIAS